MAVKQRTGGIAALIEAATLVAGFVIFGAVLADYTSGDLTTAESVAFIADNEFTFYAGYLVAFIIFGIFLVPLALALHDRLRIGAQGLAPTATAFGLIWSGLVIAAGMVANIGFGVVTDLADTGAGEAAPVWLALDAVQNGLGGGNEIAGGIWVLLVSLAAIRARTLARPLAYLGIVAGAAGLVTIVPALEVFGAVFGLGLIVWLVWLGFVMMRQPAFDTALPSRARMDPAAV